MLFGNTDVLVFGIGMVGNLISDVPGVSYVDGGDFFLDLDMGQTARSMLEDGDSLLVVGGLLEGDVSYSDFSVGLLDEVCNVRWELQQIIIVSKTNTTPLIYFRHGGLHDSWWRQQYRNRSCVSEQIGTFDVGSLDYWSFLVYEKDEIATTLLSSMKSQYLQLAGGQSRVTCGSHELYLVVGTPRNLKKVACYKCGCDVAAYECPISCCPVSVCKEHWDSLLQSLNDKECTCIGVWGGRQRHVRECGDEDSSDSDDESYCELRQRSDEDEETEAGSSWDDLRADSESSDVHTTASLIASVRSSADDTLDDDWDLTMAVDNEIDNEEVDWLKDDVKKHAARNNKRKHVLIENAWQMSDHNDEDGVLLTESCDDMVHDGDLVENSHFEFALISAVAKPEKITYEFDMDQIGAHVIYNKHARLLT